MMNIFFLLLSLSVNPFISFFVLQLLSFPYFSQMPLVMCCTNRTFSNSSMSVFILQFSHFDVNLFRHCHFRFITVSVNKTNFLYKMDFTSIQVAKFRRLLQEKCVSCFFFYWKHLSERLCTCKLAYFKSLLKLLILIHTKISMSVTG